MLEPIRKWITLRLLPKKLSAAEHEYHHKSRQYKLLLARRTSEEWRRGYANAFTEAKIAELWEWLQQYEENKRKKELEEEALYLEALAEFDAEIPRQ